MPKICQGVLAYRLILSEMQRIAFSSIAFVEVRVRVCVCVFVCVCVCCVYVVCMCVCVCSSV